MDFLRDLINKKELFAFLTSKLREFYWPHGKEVFVTSRETVSSVGKGNHGEADTRIVVHILHAQ